jgi:hypothetical protein
LARVATGRWGAGVSPGRWGGADWGCRVERVRERESVRSWARFAMGAPLPSVHLHGTKSIRERRREGWPARLSPGRSCKERKKKREEKKKV